MKRRRALAALAACTAGAAAGLHAPPAASAGDDAVFEGFAGTRVRFADVDTGRALLGADDEWTRATGDFQRRAVTGRAEPVPDEAFRRWNADAVQAWTDTSRQRWRDALDALVPGFAALRIPLPPEVWIVASNGQESALAPYTRGAAVVLTPLPPSVAGRAAAWVMAHELWHVASRHAQALATRLYAEIGFEPIAPLDFPFAWAARRIANPDAPAHRHAMRLRVEEGREALVTPLLVASRTTLQPGETFFSVAETRLVEVVPAGAASRVVQRDGEPVWHRPDGPHDYLRRLGGNTGYVIHPEETMAENVALLATGAPVRNADLAARLRAVFDSPR